MSDLDLSAYDVLTFDCYGTLIDWDSGLLGALTPILAVHGVEAPREQLLDLYARHEAALEDGAYRPYREVVGGVLRGIGDDLGFAPTDAEIAAFADSVGEWPPFEDSADALTALQQRFGLAVITNCDEDLFARSQERLGVRFDWVVTAQRARSYKPDHRNFEVAFATLGVPRERILHVAQSLYHDHVPAKALGLRSVWINRRGEPLSLGAEPDLIAPDMRTFAAIATA